jgi:hypothetical protein
MNCFRFVGLFLVLTVSVESQAGFLNPFKTYEEWLFGNAAKMNTQMLSSCADCSTAEDSQADRACLDQYNAIYGKGVVSIHMAFGYMDASEVPGGGVYGGVKLQPNQSIDEVSSLGLVEQLLKPCRWHRNGACGFERDSSDAEVLVKPMHYHGQPVTVKIRVTHASATPFLATNIGPEAELQAAMTERSELNFFESLGASDLTIYTGHARGGGGPDFMPPHLTKDGEDNYDGYYRKVKPGLKHLLSSLSQASHKPPLLAILGCKTDSLFKQPVLKVAPEMGLITTTEKTYFEDGFQNTFIVIDSFLKKECGATFQKSLQVVKASNGARLVMTNFLQ